MWEKLVNNYERDTKVISEKLQSYQIQFEALKMHEDECVANFFLGADEVVNI